ncbi:SRPBCC family protein [Janibacter sp. GS2]|uniref:SRPBCC family protein n=1 Tax=Janibacter sp. GS2 TaxID=3442646 RepID=UPI003EB7ACF0
MKIENQAVVAAQPSQVFALINDVERVASCMPGAELVGREGEDGYRGRVSVRVGPIGASFEGVLRFLEVDESARTMHIVGRGTDVKGNGEAEADVRLGVHEHPDGAVLSLTTELNIRGKFVQFGKGAIATVSTKVLNQFAANMAALLDQDQAAPADPSTVAASESEREVGAAQKLAPASTSAGMGMLLDEPTRRTLTLVGTFIAGCLEGWILTRAFGRRR